MTFPRIKNFHAAFLMLTNERFERSIHNRNLSDPNLSAQPRQGW